MQRGGNKEGTRQELLAATHCIRPSNGWNLTTTTNVTVSLLTMRSRYTRNRFLSSHLGCVTSCYKCEYLPKSDISVAFVPLVNRPTLCSRCSTGLSLSLILQTVVFDSLTHIYSGFAHAPHVQSLYRTLNYGYSTRSMYCGRT